MKIGFMSAGKARKREQGSTLILALLISAITLPLLISYLARIHTQYSAVNRSQDWNAALAVAESGIEEGFAHLNVDCYANVANGNAANWTTNGWSSTTNTAQSIPTRYMDTNHSYSYSVRIVTNFGSATTQTPQIVCVGTVKGASSANGGSVSRQVRVSTKLGASGWTTPGFNMGLLSSGDINAHLVDAYNSQESDESFYTLYDSRYHTAEATVGSLSGTVSGTIYGYVQTGQSNKFSGTAGDLTYMAGNNNGAQSNHYSANLNTTMSQVTLPPATFATLAAWNKNFTYTNISKSAVTVTTIDFPNPLPPGPITTNITGYGTTTNYPSPAPTGGVTTNTISTTLATLPSPIPLNYLSVVTNTSGLTWRTNNAANQTVAPTYPSSYSTPPGVFSSYQWVSNYLSGPPASGSYRGSWSYVYVTDKKGNVSVDTSKSGKTTLTNYTYEWLSYYYYALPTTNYNISYYQYSYTNRSYTYETTNAAQTTVSGNVDYVIPDGYWQSDNFSAGTVVVTGNAVLYLPNGFSMSGQSQIIILPGASLRIYTGGNVSLSGQAKLNENGVPANLTIFGLDSATSISFSGNAGIVGAIYARNADVTGNGGGNDRADIRGVIAASKSFTSNGHFFVHIDVSLLGGGTSGSTAVGGFVASGWVEEAVGTGP